MLEILKSQDDSVITVEGIVEDVEIVTPAMMTAIQCKYHEASETFTPSGIFKPLLQMMHHFHANPDANIRYILFAHYPSVKGSLSRQSGKPNFKRLLIQRTRTSRQYIATLRGKVDLDGSFLDSPWNSVRRLTILLTQVSAALKANGIPDGDIETLAYPNAIHMIAGISVKHDPTERKITKRQFLAEL